MTFKSNGFKDRGEDWGNIPYQEYRNILEFNDMKYFLRRMETDPQAIANDKRGKRKRIPLLRLTREWTDSLQWEIASRRALSAPPRYTSHRFIRFWGNSPCVSLHDCPSITCNLSFAFEHYELCRSVTDLGCEVLSNRPKHNMKEPMRFFKKSISNTSLSLDMPEYTSSLPLLEDTTSASEEELWKELDEAEKMVKIKRKNEGW
uniref:Uncharacterized protein n=1 Tax=Heterorhabditis bacteriophora TaxID=37862 RepID=A0A1I7XV18_HETBA